jgi:hypothetical protein
VKWERAAGPLPNRFDMTAIRIAIHHVMDEWGHPVEAFAHVNRVRTRSSKAMISDPWRARPRKLIHQKTFASRRSYRRCVECRSDHAMHMLARQMWPHRQA